LSLRVAGATLQQIADTPTSADDPTPLYTSKQRAHEAVQTALREIQKENRGQAENLRALELARLDSMQVALWPGTRATKAIRCEGTCQCGAKCNYVLYREPDQGAVDRVLKIQERRAKYVPSLDVGNANEERLVQIQEHQVALAHQAMVEAMGRAGIPPEQQREVLEYAAEFLRENDPDEA
jgi:hypothetical protein